jgi:molecular chaperone GrpE
MADVDEIVHEAEAISDEADEIAQEAEIITAEADKSVDELASLKDKYLRLAAEYDNFRKRTKKEREYDFQWAQSDLIKKLLPVLDTLERGIRFNEKSDSIEAVKEGFIKVLKMFTEVLEKEGLEPIAETGIHHDLNLHDLVFAEENDELEDGTILEIFETGYKLNDKVLRHAKVKVSKSNKPAINTES